MNVVYSIIAIGIGATGGAAFRWLLGHALHALYPSIPPGTLAANWLGAYIIGLVSSIFAACNITSSSYLYLMVITGFLGALTTFSTFTHEMGTLIRHHEYWTAVGGIALHVCGSLILFFLGIATFMLFHHAE
ncbi:MULTISPECIES: fluoride efflux transporter CrcB [unclassified Desulfovibrio]|uniref:fluoride efflux transporter CrcB n=1 Tax=unclassified Desulfovibrio TaxID=2593640 RepID=UPI0013ECCCA7|nr:MULTISPECIES: fluoride efflux transporter CrcB [unclassified Desulfovibrio]